MWLLICYQIVINAPQFQKENIKWKHMKKARSTPHLFLHPPNQNPECWSTKLSMWAREAKGYPYESCVQKLEWVSMQLWKTGHFASASGLNRTRLTPQMTHAIITQETVAIWISCPVTRSSSGLIWKHSRRVRQKYLLWIIMCPFEGERAPFSFLFCFAVPQIVEFLLTGQKRELNWVFPDIIGNTLWKGKEQRMVRDRTS